MSRPSIQQSQGFPSGSAGKKPPANAEDARDMGLIPGLVRYPGEGNGNLLQYSRVEDSMDRGQSYCPWGCKELDMTEHAHKS